MKVIDLLNKIANGEKVPEFIEVTNRFTKENEILFTCTENIFYCLDNNELTLNSIISAVEDKEEKDIEELDIQTNNGEAVCLRNEAGTLCGMNKHSIVMAKKINELIKAVNKLREGK
jgi:hypothetical protein